MLDTDLLLVAALVCKSPNSKPSPKLVKASGMWLKLGVAFIVYIEKSERLASKWAT